MGFVVKHRAAGANGTFACYTVYQTLASLSNTESMTRTGKMAQWVTVLASKPDDLSLTSGIQKSSAKLCDVHIPAGS